MAELSLAITVLNLLIVAYILTDARRGRRRAERLRDGAAERLRETLMRELSCGQWCTLHDQHMDDPQHPYCYPECERRLRRATAAEEAELSDLMAEHRASLRPPTGMSWQDRPHADIDR